jgi:hypothetical protein
MQRRFTVSHTRIAIKASPLASAVLLLNVQTVSSKFVVILKRAIGKFRWLADVHV